MEMPVVEAGRRFVRPRLARLTALDASNLRIEDHGVPMHVAALAIVHGASLRDASGRLHEEAIREHLERRTHLAPRLRQKLRSTPLAAGPPVWIDDPAFDISKHVRIRDLGYPADEASMLKACSDLNETPLDRSRPLWEVWVLTGRDDGNVALLIRLHHVVADGIAALDMLGVLFDRTADGPSRRPSQESPTPPPQVRDLYADQLCRQTAAVWRASFLPGRPGQAGRRLALRLGQMRRLIRDGAAPLVSLNEPVGTRRRLMLVRADLASAKTAAHAHDATVNDVVLAAMAGGARRLLEGRGELVPDLVLRVSVAASLRGTGDEVTSGNRVGVRLAPLPVCEPDAVRRLRYIATVTAGLRGEPPYQPGGRLLQRWMVRIMFRQRLVNLLMSNLPGPPEPLYFSGAQVLEMFQVGLVQGNVPLSVGVLSYAGQLNFDIIADADAIPDVAIFADGLSAALDDLGVRPVDWSRRGSDPG
jgi:diacylglycerol O-acyltransferase / wax synthase